VIDNHGLVVVIHIPVAVALLDYNGVVVIPVITIADDFTVAITITIAITVAGTDRHADRTDAYSNFIRTCRHRKGYSSYGYRSHYKMFHRMFLGL
jgi:hypothetical protein